MNNHYDVVLTKHMADEWFTKSRSPDHEHEFQHILAADIMLAIRVPRCIVDWLTEVCGKPTMYMDDTNANWMILYGNYSVTFRFQRSSDAVLFKMMLM